MSDSIPPSSSGPVPNRAHLPFHKKRWLIKSQIQRVFLFYSICMSVVTLGVVLVRDVVANQFFEHDLAWGVRAFAFSIFFIYLMLGFWLSNRVAGPLFRLEKHMNDVADGKSSAEIQFRDKDYNAELASAFNEVIRKRIQK